MNYPTCHAARWLEAGGSCRHPAHRRPLIGFQRDVADMAGDDGHEWRPCEWCSGEVRTIADIAGTWGPVVECLDCGRISQVVDAL